MLHADMVKDEFMAAEDHILDSADPCYSEAAFFWYSKSLAGSDGKGICLVVPSDGSFWQILLNDPPDALKPRMHSVYPI